MDSIAASPLVILNPAANRGHMLRHRLLVQQRAQQVQAEYVETYKQGEACTLAFNAASLDRPIIIVGGDGSVNEVVNGILGSGHRVPLGIVPAGSGNDFAYNTLGLPRELDLAIEVAFNGQPRTVDAGCVNDTFFANGFSVGLDANIAFATKRLRKLPLMSGTRLYYSATVQEILFGYRHCPWLRPTFDDRIENAREQRYVLIAVTNGPAYGAGFYINPHADPCDGLLDVCTVDYLPLLRLLKLFPGVREGRHIHEPEVRTYRVRHVQLESREPLILQIDGETSRATVVNASILPAALQVCVA
jgi:diacylglycerol kinase (ATP)